MSNKSDLADNDVQRIPHYQPLNVAHEMDIRYAVRWYQTSLAGMTY
jgi:hypothetical protein